MHRLVGFGRRKATAESMDGVTEPSFRVLERAGVAGGKPDGANSSGKEETAKTGVSAANLEDNIAVFKFNRGSSKATSDDSSHHSIASTAPSSADILHPAVSKPSFFKTSHTFSFTGSRKLPPLPTSDTADTVGLARPSPRSTQTEPAPSKAAAASSGLSLRLHGDLELDFGDQFGTMVLDQKNSATAEAWMDRTARPAASPRAPNHGRSDRPSPMALDQESNVGTGPASCSTAHSIEDLLSSSRTLTLTNSHQPSLVPPHISPVSEKHARASPSPESVDRSPLKKKVTAEDEQGEKAKLLKDSLENVSKCMAIPYSAQCTSPPASRYRRDEDRLESSTQTSRTVSGMSDDDSLIDKTPSMMVKPSGGILPRRTSFVQQKVTAWARLERCVKEKGNEEKGRDRERGPFTDTRAEERVEILDEDDELERARQQAKQMQKQEAHMATYRQQTMKATGGTDGQKHGHRAQSVSGPGLQMSVSTPDLGLPMLSPGEVGLSDEDEEVPLAILAAHGFPNKNRLPARLTTMSSNPNLRVAQQASYRRPGSAMSDAHGSNGASGASSRLPAFARNLPQDPFVGAAMVRNPARESFALGVGTSPACLPGSPLPPGGLVGVIASEERSRAMRRGSPRVDVPHPTHLDLMGGMPMMYPPKSAPAMLTPGDRAQIQMTQQMQQFMQMQMQFMQMMAGQNGQTGQANSSLVGVSGTPGTPGMLAVAGMGRPDLMRHSIVGHESIPDPLRNDSHSRTMSMVQPGSSSWFHGANQVQTPSSHVQGGEYAPSLAPSERSNVGLPGRYRPVTQLPPAPSASILGSGHMRNASTPSGTTKKNWTGKSPSAANAAVSDEEDDEQGWEAMKAKRNQRQTGWKSKKTMAGKLPALIS